MKNKSMSAYKRFSLFVAASVLALMGWACQLTQNSTTEDTVSFTKLYDSLSKYDSVIIVFKDRDGKVLDTVYRGKVDTHAEIENLPVKNWDGGPVLISIVGLDGGVPVYKIEKRFDGKTDKTDTTFILFVPGTSLSTPIKEFKIIAGDSIPFPPITITPANLSDKTLNWSSSQLDAVLISGSFLKAINIGNSQITVKLNADPSKSLTLSVIVLANTRIPDSVIVSPKPISLAASGAPIHASVRITPSSASNVVTWKVDDATIATVSIDGMVQGLIKGNTKLWAYSKENPNKFDSTSILVSDPVPVEIIRFPKSSIDLFVGGSAESLFVNVTPVLANSAADFQSVDPSIAAIKDNRLTGIAEGKTMVIAKSKENPAKTDTLKVNVLIVIRLDSVRVKHPTLPIYTGGEALNLTAQVYPSTAPQQIKWRSGNTANATVNDSGKVTAVSPGKMKIFAISQADSLKKDSTEITVKRDMPQVSVGQDTTVSVGQNVSFLPHVTQEYGTVNLFQWDLDGDGAWDGSSDSIKTVSYKYDVDSTYLVKFHVKDTEGNDTTVFKKVKAVKGPVVLIQSPLNNTYTNQLNIKVKWTINDMPQDSTPTALKDGANIITRTAKDAAGNPFSTSITVYLDTTAPNKPLVHGATPTSSTTPTWTWTSGGGGAGIFRTQLDGEEFTSALVTKDTTYTPATDQKEGLHTLFVQERDAAGNWSPSGRFGIRIDLSGPGKPVVKVSPASITNVRTPTWTWQSGGGGAKVFQFKLDNSDLSTETNPTTDTSFIPTKTLPVGPHILYVQEKDSAGNWSASGSSQVTIDTIAPNAPTVSVAPVSPTNNTKPTWTWTADGAEVAGKFRYKLDDSNFGTGAVEIHAVTYTPGTADALKEGAHVLYVQQQDSAGNWSTAGSATIRIDLTPPSVPAFSALPLSPLNSLKPVWVWASGGNGGSGAYRCKLDDAALESGAILVGSGQYTPAGNLSEAPHTLYVQERDSAGNWSAVASRELVLALRGVVGVPGFAFIDPNNGASSTPSLALDSKNAPYIAFADGDNQGRITVKRWSGSIWETQGSIDFALASMSYSPSPYLAISTKNVPYIAFSDTTNRAANDGYTSATVMRFNGTTWDHAGIPDFSERLGSLRYMVLSSTDIPFVATEYNNATVMRFNGVKSKWDTVGNSDLTPLRSSLSSMVLSNTGVPYVAFPKYSASKAAVMRLNGTSWEYLGDAAGFSEGGAGSPTLAFSSTGVPYIAFSDEAKGGKATVMWWNGTTWVNLGDAGFTLGRAYPSLAISSTGVPYIAFQDGSVVTLMRWSGSAWETIGSAGLSLSGFSWQHSLVISGTGVPYIAGTNGNKIAVVKFSFDP